MLNKLAFNSSKSTIKAINNLNVKNFATAAKGSAPAGDDMAHRFHDIYIKELEKLQKTNQALIAASYKVRENVTPTEGYIHPYHSTKFPIYWSNHNLSTYMMEAIGTEPVSPHYESFSRSRKYPILMAGAIYLLTLLQNVNLNNMYGQQAVYQFYTLVGFGIGIFEMRYVLQKLPAPRATWFYDAFIEHEFRQMGNSWQDTIEERSKKFLAISKEQIDYYLIHKEFAYIKKRSISTYLENEKTNLQKHFYDRTLNMLKTVENLENNNIRNKIKQIAEDSLKSIINKANDTNERKNIHQAAFLSALEGLRTGKMTYTNDPLLPVFVNEVNSLLQPLKKLTKEQESQMFSLTSDQKRLVADGDHRAKVEYLSTPPNVASASVKNTDVFKSITNRMKRRIESTFK